VQQVSVKRVVQESLLSPATDRLQTTMRTAVVVLPSKAEPAAESGWYLWEPTRARAREESASPTASCCKQPSLRERSRQA
jgi:hypothetical protein